jgi:hypothetical protein
VDDALADLSTGWTLRSYPWAGAVSTAHTVLYYDKMGPDAFRTLARDYDEGAILGRRRIVGDLRFDPAEAAEAAEREGAIWATLVEDERRVSRAGYEALAKAAPLLKPSPLPLAFMAGQEPQRARARTISTGRRPSHSSNSTRR